MWNLGTERNGTKVSWKFRELMLNKNATDKIDWTEDKRQYTEWNKWNKEDI